MHTKTGSLLYTRTNIPLTIQDRNFLKNHCASLAHWQAEKSTYTNLIQLWRHWLHHAHRGHIQCPPHVSNKCTNNHQCHKGAEDLPQQPSNKSKFDNSGKECETNNPEQHLHTSATWNRHINQNEKGPKGPTCLMMVLQNPWLIGAHSLQAH